MRIKIISAIIILTALAACQKSDPIIPVQEIKLDIYDNVGETKTITIKINVEA